MTLRTQPISVYDGRAKSDGSVEHVLRVLGPAAHLTDGLARPLVEVVYQAPTPTAPPTRSLRFVHADPLGSPDVLTDAQGQPLEAKSYEAFGAPRSPDGHGGQGPAPSLTSLGFTGHEDDRELGLVNMRGRVYDPVLARFLQADPLVQAPSFSLSWNPYAYAFHSPLRYTDPSGFQAEGGDPYHRDENRAPYVCATPECAGTPTPVPTDPTVVGPWGNGVETTGPAPYGGQPPAAAAVPPSQPLWSPGVAGLPINEGVEVDDDDGVSFGAAPGFVEATAVLAGVGAWRLLGSDAALGLMARAQGAFEALSNLAAGLLEGVAPGATGGLALAGAGAGAAGARVVGQAEGAGARAFGRAGDWLRSLSKGSGSSAKSTEKMTTLYRTISDAERQTIASTGKYAAPVGGVEGKYFYPTIQQAEALARANFSSQGAQTLTSVRIPTSLLQGLSTFHVAGEGKVIFLSTEQLQSLGTPQVWASFPVKIGF